MTCAFCGCEIPPSPTVLGQFCEECGDVLAI